jgi:rhodanese-related sulfurtransferase
LLSVQAEVQRFFRLKLDRHFLFSNLFRKTAKDLSAGYLSFERKQNSQILSKWYLKPFKKLNLMSSVEENISQIKDKVTGAIPTPDPQQMPVSTAKALKERLDWGEPALTIIDVSDREVFNKEHITGAQSMPMAELAEKASQSLERNRDIYVYGEQGQGAEAASQLREAGFTSVSELEGGLSAWKEISGATDGQMT